MNAYIYLLLIPVNLIILNMFKVGKTKQKDFLRLKDYPKDTQTFLYRKCNNCDEMEKQILEKFNEKFMLAKGREYFEGDYNEMIKIINDILDNEQSSNQTIPKPEIICHMFGKDDDVYEMSIKMKKPVQCNNRKTTILCIKKHIEHKSLIEFLKTINHFAIIIHRGIVSLFKHQSGLFMNSNGSYYKYENHCWIKSNQPPKTIQIDVNSILHDASTYLCGESSKRLSEATKIGSADPNYSSFQEDATRLLECSQKINQIIKENNNLNEMDENVYLIGCNNGIYDLQRMEFRDGRPDDLITMSSKIDYNHDFNWSDQRIIDIMEFISKVLPNKHVREYVLQIFASCLDSTAKQKKFYIFSGSGGNGKSKLIELLDKALGDYSNDASIKLLTKKRVDPKLTKITSQRLIKFQETEISSKINTNLMKELTVGDKYTFTPFLICNDRPELQYDDDDLWRRIRLIDFISRFVPDESDIDPTKNVFQIDYDLSEKINTWGDAFLWILIEYYKKYREAGSKIKDPEEVIEYTNVYRKQNDIFNNFFNDCIIKNSLNDLFYLNDAFREYKVWFKENFQGTGQKLQKKDELHRYFTKKLGEPNQSDKGFYWLGYQLKPYHGGAITTNTAHNLIDELDK